MPKALTRDEALAAAELLGVADIDTATADDAKDCWRRAVKRVHPDSSTFAELEADAPARLRALSAARAVLERWIRERPDPNCPACQGKGYIRSGRLHVSPCIRCQK